MHIPHLHHGTISAFDPSPRRQLVTTVNSRQLLYCMVRSQTEFFFRWSIDLAVGAVRR